MATARQSSTIACFLLAASAGLGAPSIAWAQGEMPPSDGKALYQAKCGGCHSEDENRIGPLHRGVVGRQVASVPGYDYSDALKKVGGVWTAAKLDTWLQGPQAVALGSKMFFTVDDPDQRKSVITYLVSISPPALP